MGGNYFEQIAQELLKQKKQMERLKTENSELRQQLAHLRAGQGIFVEIYGTRFALRDNSSLVKTPSASSAPTNDSTSTPTVAISTPTAKLPPLEPAVDEPETELAETANEMQESEVEEQVSPSDDKAETKSTSKEPTFLEEIMIDQFANVVGSPNAVWQGPETEKKPAKQQRKQEEPIDEKQKAALRRELMGSFLLE